MCHRLVRVVSNHFNADVCVSGSHPLDLPLTIIKYIADGCTEKDSYIDVTKTQHAMIFSWLFYPAT